MRLSYSTSPHKTIEYYLLPYGQVDVFLRRNETTETNEDEEISYVAEEVYLQVEKTVSKKDIEDNFDYYWNLSQKKKLSDKEQIEQLNKSVILLDEKQSNSEPLFERMKTATEIYEENKFDDSMPLEALKALRIGKLKEECQSAIMNGFSLSGNDFGFNYTDQTNMTQMFLLVVAGRSEAIEWKTKNNGVITMPVTEFQQVISASEKHKMNEQRKYWLLEQQINAATTKDEVKEITWNTTI